MLNKNSIGVFKSAHQQENVFGYYVKIFVCKEDIERYKIKVSFH